MPALIIGETRGGDAALKVIGVELLVVLAALIGVVAVGVGRRLAGPDSEADAIAEALADDPDQQRLLARWLSRARWARFVGGVSGIVIWWLGTQGKADVFLLGTGGIAIGAMLAELHNIRPRQGPRTARLDVRSISDYLTRRDAQRMVGCGLAASAVAIAGAIAHEAALWWGLTAVVALISARLAQRRVAKRPRPAVPTKLLRADDLARELAIGPGIARPATYFALGLVARGCYSLQPAIGEAGRVIAIAAWIYAIYLWWNNRGLVVDLQRHDPLIT